ncbi:MAG TPA: thioredoxin domain-containing protein [Pyrinomonadaceae bacterium]|jgi:protein-disulfide isomerase
MKITKYISLFMVIGGIIAGSAAGLWLSGYGKSHLTTVRSEPLKSLSSAAAGAEPAHAKGAENAVVTIEEFADFECPPCARLYSEIRKMKEEYGDRVRFVFRHYPLDSHQHAAEAAKAAEAAAMQGKFWEMHNILFERQDEWSSAENTSQLFADYARSLALDTERFRRDVNSEQVNNRVTADRKRGESVEIEGTPSLFINGTEVSSEAMTPEGIRTAIKAALR